MYKLTIYGQDKIVTTTFNNIQDASKEMRFYLMKGIRSTVTIVNAHPKENAKKWGLDIK